MKIYLLLSLLVLETFLFKIFGQEVLEHYPPDHIKTIQFYGKETLRNFPVVSVGEIMTLEFDDLLGDESDYYYRIKHFNWDWTPSSLFQNEFLDGFDNLRIDNYRTSFNTLQSYTHFTLAIPNENVQFKISGNYMLEIYTADDTLAFSRRFCIYEPSATVQVAVYRPQNLDRFYTHQSIHFKITPQMETFRNPDKNIFVTLLQNDQWDSKITGLTPQYYQGASLEYRYEYPAQFEGGNEYFFFDSKDLRVTSSNITFTQKKDLYETYLKVDIPRSMSEYSFAPDINGAFEIRNIMRPGDSDIEADYSLVYFSLASNFNLENDQIYVYGGFNNYQLSEYNAMYFNPALGLYESVILLKQGFYNYKYVVKKEGGLYKNEISGSFALTENNYLVLVYYRAIGTQFDALVGVGVANSFELKN
ncbi:MAG: DUF5103 domain-containing protein [Flavobacteriaceae bacterium]